MNSDDSLEVTENTDGTFTLSWDPNDVKYSHLNGLTEEEIGAMVEMALENFLKDYDQSLLESNE
jgi:hypothetical protein